VTDLLFANQGMTMSTPEGPVDMVPLQRRLEGDKTTPIVDDERPAAILALTHLGVSMDHIHRVLNMAHRDVKAVLLKHGMEPIYPPKEIAWTGVAQTSSKQRRTQRLAERIEVDGRPYHPEAPHGSELAYTEYGCHCQADRDAHAAKLRADRDKKKMRVAA